MSAEDAARILATIERHTPGTTGASMAANGQPMRLDIPGGSLLMVLDIVGDALWIEGAKGEGAEDMTTAGLAWAEATARRLGCKRVGFMTQRRGLVRKAERHGYTAQGLELFKEV